MITKTELPWMPGRPPGEDERQMRSTHGLKIPENAYKGIAGCDVGLAAGRERAVLDELKMDEQILVCKGLDNYPDSLPYHNRQHGVDVIGATIEQAARCGFNEHCVKLLTIAAAWHDAGFDHDEEVWSPYGSKESYAVYLMSQALNDRYNQEDLAFIERAIMGTMMGPNATRNTPEASFLHLMDLSYLWSEPETFLDGAMAVWKEEFPHLDTKQFLDLQEKFLPSYREELVKFMMERGVPKEKIEEMAHKIDANTKAITEKLEGKLASTRVGAAAVVTAIAS